MFSVTEDLTTSSSTFLGGSSTFLGGSSVFLGKTEDLASSTGFFELVISPVTDFTKGLLLIALGASSLGFSATGSFFQGLLLTAGFSATGADCYTGLSSACFLFHGKDAPPPIGALTSSFLGALLDTVAPKGAFWILQ